MKRLIIRSIQALSTIIIVLMLASGILSGAATGYEAGYSLPALWAVLGAIVGLIVAYVVACLVFGALFILIDMDDSLRAIRELLERERAAKA